jgi:vancomycin resistance protein VanW
MTPCESPRTGRAREWARPVFGSTVRRLRREAQWLDPRIDFRLNRAPEPLAFKVAEHATPLVRPLLGLDPELQRNKVVNLRIAAASLDGLVLSPGRRLSFWLHVGRPSYARGFVDGLVLDHGRLSRGVGGGLCQMTNLLYWMTLHTPLDVVERWRHSYDVFPDAGRSQPFGSGATCAWPALDLQVENRTAADFRLSLTVTDTDLEGAWTSSEPSPVRFEVYEQAHLITRAGPGVYMRHNRLWRREIAEDGRVVRDLPLTENHALLMYEPYLAAGGEEPAAVSESW